MLFRRLYSTAASTSYQYILTSVSGKVGVVQLNRPKALNALCDGLFTELNEALRKFDDSKEIGAIVITGNEKAFAGKCYYPSFCPSFFSNINSNCCLI